MLNMQYPLHMSLQYGNFGLLTAEIGSGVWDTPANFNRFHVLPSLLRQSNFAAWYKKWNYGSFAEGAAYIRLGGHHVGHRPTFLFSIMYIHQTKGWQ